jgi:hypothetical protein
MRLASSPAFVAALLACLLIAGCSADFNAPPSLTNETNAIGTIQGNLHGGQQPIQNAHIFVLAVGTGGDAGPGIAASTANKATSLITSTTAGAAFELTSPTLTEYLQVSQTNQVRANSGIAIDSANNIWAVAQTSGTTNGISNECLAKINPASPSTITTCYLDTAMQGDGVAIDGSGNIWVANGQVTDGIGGVEFNSSGAVISPAGGFSGGAQNYPISVAVDGSGDVWLPGTGASYTGTTVVELIGIATPVVTPISPI